MCLLSVYGPGVQPDEAHLRNGAEVNGDGAGYVIATGGQLIVAKSLDTDGIVSDFLRVRQAQPDGWAVSHLRLSTGSPVTEDNLHPMTVAGDDRTLVGHNGTLPYGQWATADGYSDTRIFCEETFPQLFADLDDEVTVSLLTSWATPANKLVIVTANPRYAKPVYIVHEDQFLRTPDGALHSNPDFLGRGKGWDQGEIDGETYRWNLWQPGQCHACHAYHDGGRPHPMPLRYSMPRERSETQRLRMVAAANERERNNG